MLSWCRQLLCSSFQTKTKTFWEYGGIGGSGRFGCWRQPRFIWQTSAGTLFYWRQIPTASTVDQRHTRQRGKENFWFSLFLLLVSLVYLVLYLLFSRLHIKIGDYFETINTKTFFNKTFCRSETSANPYTVFTRRKDNKDLIQCPTPGCDGMGHSTGNYSTHRR